jgi:thymidylate synthase (FAD)
MNVKLIWTTPNGEQLIGDMARVSAPENQGTDASGLIRYLITHDHWSPLEMVNAVFEIETTRDIARQILRHRSFSFQEFSQRYAEVDKLPKAEPREARLQDKKNRQNSIEFENPDTKADWQSYQTWVAGLADEAYHWALNAGIAKEVARAVLPEGLTTSRMYMNGTLRSWIHYTNLRSGNGTQKEHMEIAVAIRDTLKEHYPNVWAALG